MFSVVLHGCYGVIVDSQWFSVVLPVCFRRISMLLSGSQLVLVASQRFSVVRTASRRFSVILVSSQCSRRFSMVLIGSRRF